MGNEESGDETKKLDQPGHLLVEVTEATYISFVIASTHISISPQPASNQLNPPTGAPFTSLNTFHRIRTFVTTDSPFSVK